MKSQPAFNDSLEAKAVKFLKSMCMGGQESADAFLSNFGQTSDASLTDFIQSIVVLVSSSHQVITSTAIKMVMNLITRCSVRILLLLVKAALMPRLINTLNPLSLSFAEAVDIHTFLIRIISCSLWPSTPDCLQELGIKDDSEQQSVHETVLKQVLMPSDKTRQEEGKKRTKQLPSPRHPTISRPSSSFSALSTPIAHSLTCDSFSATVCVHSRFGSLCVTDRGCLLTLFTNRACPILAPSSSELHLNVCKQFTFANPRHACSCDFIAHSSSIPPSREINSADICTPMPASSLHARELATMKLKPAFDNSLEAKAVKFLESMFITTAAMEMLVTMIVHCSAKFSLALNPFGLAYLGIQAVKEPKAVYETNPARTKDYRDRPRLRRRNTPKQALQIEEANDTIAEGM
ncbi:hypothetical protein BLNAU_4133 [Blattamonas nauphoetae]|uniref:C-CAP/cofactor C-like domain-containing protein n=1 Tax=Blattamonas nauphoetae TaxID=2049346 RepID=A0ABQ9YB98_9EUKA|nr:hypothetical protein BLNAU_4133 [Blattamonas nauphoetae]